MSPVLFGIYMDNLLTALKDNGTDCHVCTHYRGSFAYADDAILPSPSVSRLQSMLDVCSKFGDDYKVKFNPGKSKCVTFYKKTYQLQCHS